MVVETEYYEILGVSPTADGGEIRKQYRKLAIRHHPDKSDAPDAAEVFAKISSAYEVLSDESKRAVYDRYGAEGLQRDGGGGGGGRGHPFAGHEDIFASLFGQAFGGGGGGGGGGRQERRGNDVGHEYQVSLEDLYNGREARLALSRKQVCGGCRGKGGSSVKTCSTCSGRGVRFVMRSLGAGFVQRMQMECRACDGEGATVDPQDVCEQCFGNKVVESREVKTLYVEKGMRDGQRITFRGMGDEQPGVRAGDVVIILREQKHKRFKRDGKDLHMRRRVNLYEALCGFSFELQHLDGRRLLIRQPAGRVLKPGDVKCVPGEGMPLHRSPFEKGDLIIHFEIVFPDRVPESLALELHKLLPTPVAATSTTAATRGKAARPKRSKRQRAAADNEDGDGDEDSFVEEVSMVDYSPTSSSGASSSTAPGNSRDRQAYESDDSDDDDDDDDDPASFGFHRTGQPGCPLQ